MDADRVVIADILHARGIRGEVLAKSQTDVPGRFQSLKGAQVRLTDGKDLPLQLESAWEHKGDWVLKFSGINSIEEAERLCGAELWVPRDHRGQLTEGEYFQSDLLGCQVMEKYTGRALGIVAGWQQYGGPPLMEVKREGGEVLIPFVPAICQEVDLSARLIRVELPEGLLEL
ncbi:MAG: 16S rRNA processing protein RimM [Acidobacteriaceae bacterium]|nr:16S rRNA processing protein RimM [Acidobacteriaceae bacterium]MBV9038576.1 16S rRNA processing protein RimM [Acidobacteriaceae bacterium]MBV9306869.1 16S rRNA processing protein RimM [Acidobacteriaceae bacterium]